MRLGTIDESSGIRSIARVQSPRASAKLSLARRTAQGLPKGKQPSDRSAVRAYLQALQRPTPNLLPNPMPKRDEKRSETLDTTPALEMLPMMVSMRHWSVSMVTDDDAVQARVAHWPV